MGVHADFALIDDARLVVMDIFDGVFNRDDVAGASFIDQIY